MKRILLVDDSPDILDGLSLVLEEHYEVVAVGNGEDALFIMAEERFDLVLVDLMMPLVDGATFIRTLNDKRDRTPLVLMSASLDLVEHGLALGVPTLAKPFEPELLMRVVESMLAWQRRPTHPGLLLRAVEKAAMAT
jgi:DNA-binding response OmpR family regulator